MCSNSTAVSLLLELKYESRFQMLTITPGAGMGIVIDFFGAIVPMFVVRDLQMSRNTKIVLYSVLGFSFAPAACAIGKVISGNQPTEDISCEYISSTAFYAAYSLDFL